MRCPAIALVNCVERSQSGRVRVSIITSSEQYTHSPFTRSRASRLVPWYRITLLPLTATVLLNHHRVPSTGLAVPDQAQQPPTLASPAATRLSHAAAASGSTSPHSPAYTAWHALRCIVQAPYRATHRPAVIFRLDGYVEGWVLEYG